MIENKIIQEKLVLGYTLRQIAHNYGLCYETLKKNFKCVKKNITYITNFKEKKKINQISYLNATWESLSLEEQNAYLNYKI